MNELNAHTRMSTACSVDRPILLLGVGNELRGDDRAGIAVAQALEEHALAGVRVEACFQLLPEQVDLLQACAVALIVDADVSIAPGRFRLRRVLPARSDAVRLLGHAWSPEQLAALCLELHGHAPPMLAVGIGASSFDHFADLAPLVARSVVVLSARLHRWLAQWPTPALRGSALPVAAQS